MPAYKANKMMRVTTQRREFELCCYYSEKGIRTAVHPTRRRYRVDHLNLHSNKLKGQWYVDWNKDTYKSLDQKVGAFVYSNGTFTESYQWMITQPLRLM